MININTLRLGNLLYFSDPDNNVKNAVATVKGIEDDDMVKFEATNVKDESSETRVSISTNQVSGWGNSDQFDSIPLDESWLEKLGFANEDNESWFWSYDFDDAQETFEVFALTAGGKPLGLWSIVRCPPLTKKIEFIHQLQNVFNSLTGLELKIK